MIFSSEEDWGGYGPSDRNGSGGGMSSDHHRHASSTLSTSSGGLRAHHPGAAAAASTAPPPPPPSNKGTALESLTAGGIWALLTAPYVVMVLALLIDLRPHYRVAATAPFAGCVCISYLDDFDSTPTTSPRRRRRCCCCCCCSCQDRSDQS